MEWVPLDVDDSQEHRETWKGAKSPQCVTCPSLPSSCYEEREFNYGQGDPCVHVCILCPCASPADIGVLKPWLYIEVQCLAVEIIQNTWLLLAGLPRALESPRLKQ